MNKFNMTSSNLNGKIKYILEIIQNYNDWYLIFIDRFVNIRVREIHLRNGTIVTGGKKSLILDLIDEIFIKKVYNPKSMKINAGDTVMDIGANIGIFSLYAARQGARNLFSIEPLSQNISLIKTNFKINKINKPKIIKAAVSDKKGIKKLYIGNLDSHGLLFDRNFRQKFTKFVEVPTLTLKEIIYINKITQINFLKIDCEGSEGEIIKSTKKDVWQKIDKIAIEYHDDVSTLSHREIVEKLKSVGYKTEVKVTSDFFGYIYAWKT
jgi:FkbM family methyltransferase